MRRIYLCLDHNGVNGRDCYCLPLSLDSAEKRAATSSLFVASSRKHIRSWYIPDNDLLGHAQQQLPANREVEIHPGQRPNGHTVTGWSGDSWPLRPHLGRRLGTYDRQRSISPRSVARLPRQLENGPIQAHDDTRPPLLRLSA